jgi:hypothetical protein
VMDVGSHPAKTAHSVGREDSSVCLEHRPSRGQAGWLAGFCQLLIASMSFSALGLHCVGNREHTHKPACYFSFCTSHFKKTEVKFA